jgi:hypothetical protein
MVAIPGRVRASIPAPHCRAYRARVSIYLSEQNPATLVRISFFAVLAKGSEDGGRKLEHFENSRIAEFADCQIEFDNLSIRQFENVIFLPKTFH